MSDLELKRKRIEKAMLVVGLLAVGFGVAPFIFIAIKGLVGLVIAAVVSLLVINIGVPWFAVSIANWRLKALKSAAAANPIETLENQYAVKEASLAKIRENLKESFAVFQELKSQIQEHNEKYPDRPSQFVDKCVKMKALLDVRSKKYKQAQQNLAQFAEMIEHKRSDWKIAQKMAEASKLANAGEDFQSKLLQDTALTTIQDGLNLAFSELEVSLLDEEVAQAGQQPVPAMVVNTNPTPVAAIPAKTGPVSLDLEFNMDEVFDVVPAKR